MKKMKDGNQGEEDHQEDHEKRRRSKPALEKDLMISLETGREEQLAREQSISCSIK